MKASIKKICQTGFLTALTVAATMIHLPIPATNGYINAGDAIILLTAFFFGLKSAAFVGGVGSAVADIFLGYANWAPFTLVIKAAMGVAAAAIFQRDERVSLRNVAACVVAEFVMIAGYFAGALPSGGFAYAIGAVPSNVIQAIGGVLIFTALAAALRKSGVDKLF
ncbi:MAG: ECF transporter S component [Clostridiales bacterium]|jgi:uncharacterized membrane protein|nr:ECF transporter S component [Clostridiales bacterium]